MVLCIFMGFSPVTNAASASGFFSRLPVSDRVGRYKRELAFGREARVFERFISIDWSGSDTEDRRVNLRVVEATPYGNDGTIVAPPNARRGVRAWTRAECRRYLVEALQDRSRCLIAMDFGFGYPWGADGSVFACNGWAEMLGALSRLYAEEGMARSAAQSINSFARFGGHGPYRFDVNRTDFRFYLDNETPYYRLVEIAIPQAISQWYLGSGGTVGFSSITGMAALRYLMDMRAQGEIDFRVWPQEGLVPEANKHVIVESYPAVYPEPPDYGECTDEHCRDAWKVLQWMLGKANAGNLGEYFQIASVPFGRIENVSFEEQVSFEGWIFGVR